MASKRKNTHSLSGYLLLINLHADYRRSHLLIKLFNGSLVAGGATIMLNHELVYDWLFYIPCFGILSVDKFSFKIAILLLTAIYLFVLMHREFEHFKKSTAGLIAEIENDYRTDNKSKKRIPPYNIQIRLDEISDHFNEKDPFLSKIDFLGYTTYWISGIAVVVVFILNTSFHFYP